MAARLRHIAVVVKVLEKAAWFYETAFELERVGEETLDFASYRGERGSGLKNWKEFVGAHHFGFQVDDLQEAQKKIEAAGGQFFFDLGKDVEKENFERKCKDPDGVIFDISKKGRQGTDR